MENGFITVKMQLLLSALVLGVCTMAIHAQVQPAAEPEPLPLANPRLSLDPVTQTAQLTSAITEAFLPLEEDIPGIVDDMLTIADCESYGGKDGLLMHVGPDGELVKNPNSSAAGVFQVLLYLHRDDYANLGLDPRQVGDNIEFAKELVERRHKRGLSPYGDWECSHH